MAVIARPQAAPLALVCALVSALLATLVVVPAPTEARPAPARAGASWQGLGVWYFRSRPVGGRRVPVAITFRGNELRYPFRTGVIAIAATADTAVVQLNDYDQDFGLGRLVELPADGEAGRSLDRHPLGTPLADPNGHVAFWSSKRSDGVHLVALDTSTGTKVVGPVVNGRHRVFAVEGSTAYVVDGVGKADPGVSTWSPGQPALTPLPPTFDHGGIVSDVSGDRILSLDLDDGTYVLDGAGNLLRTLPLFFGTLSPDAAHVVGYRGDFPALYLTETGARVGLTGLRGRQAWRARWSPSGVLVVDTIPRHSSGDDAEAALTFACTPADGRCRRLPGKVAVGFLPYVPSDALGQFFDYLPSSS